MPLSEAPITALSAAALSRSVVRSKLSLIDLPRTFAIVKTAYGDFSFKVIGAIVAKVLPELSSTIVPVPCPNVVEPAELETFSMKVSAPSVVPSVTIAVRTLTVCPAVTDNPVVAL